MRAFTWLMIRFMVVMVCAVFFIVGLTKHDWLEALLFGLSVAVGLTPEMLPMIVTVNLAKGAMAMAKKKVIVKRLPSIQNFGAIDILCTDKTGTLTQDRVMLERHVDITGRDSDDVLRYAYLNSYYQTGLAQPASTGPCSRTPSWTWSRSCRQVDEIPFDFQRRRMSVVVDYEGDHVLICKGAVEEIYECCTHYQIDDEVYPLIDMIRARPLRGGRAAQPRRLPGARHRLPRVSPDKIRFTVADESELILLGYIAFFDPPKDSAAKAIDAAEAGRRHGQDPHRRQRPGDAKGLPGCRASTSERDRHRRANSRRSARAELGRGRRGSRRLRPARRRRRRSSIVRPCRSAATWSGSWAMASTTRPRCRRPTWAFRWTRRWTWPRKSADIILLEKSLLVLEEGIIEGRKVFANIIKYIRMGASSNFGNMFSVVGASYFLPFLPMPPIQILTNNLLYDISQIGIPTDNVDEELIAQARASGTSATSSASWSASGRSAPSSTTPRSP